MKHLRLFLAFSKIAFSAQLSALVSITYVGSELDLGTDATTDHFEGGYMLFGTASSGSNDIINTTNLNNGLVDGTGDSDYVDSISDNGTTHAYGLGDYGSLDNPAGFSPATYRGGYWINRSTSDSEKNLLDITFTGFSIPSTIYITIVSGVSGDPEYQADSYTLSESGGSATDTTGTISFSNNTDADTYVFQVDGVTQSTTLTLSGTESDITNQGNYDLGISAILISEELSSTIPEPATNTLLLSVSIIFFVIFRRLSEQYKARM